MNRTILIIIFLSVSCSNSHYLNYLRIPLLTKFNQILNKTSLNTNCALDLKALVREAGRFKPWALNMLDASAKVPMGLLEGNMHNMGNFHQCLSIRANFSERILEGQYCSVVVAPGKEWSDLFQGLSGKLIEDITATLTENNDISLLISKISALWGLCLPKSCTVENLNRLGENIVKEFNLNVDVEFRENLCIYKNKPIKFKLLDYWVYLFFFFVFSTLLISTAYDLYQRVFDLKPNGFVIFSVYTNLKSFISTTNPKSLPCLDGIKVLCSLWIILGHTAMYLVGVSKNPFFLINEVKYYRTAVYVWTAPYGVTSFFVISGLLTTCSYLKYSTTNSVNLLGFYCARFLRLTPALIAAIFMEMSILKLFASGPYGEMVTEVYTRECYDCWWTGFLYFFDLMQYRRCLRPSWYISIDTRFYLIAPAFLFHLRKAPRKILAVLISGIFIGVSYSFIISVNKKLGFTIFQKSKDYDDYIFFSVIHHMPSWFIGLILGYILYFKKMHISPRNNAICSVLVLLGMNQLIIGQIDYLKSDYNVYKAASWIAFSNPLWSTGLAYLIFSCVTYNNSFLNKFLSLPVFKVLSKLTYSVYLVNCFVLKFLVYNVTAPICFSSFNVFQHYVTTLVLVLSCSVLFYLCFEAPILALRNIHVSKKNICEENQTSCKFQKINNHN